MSALPGMEHPTDGRWSKTSVGYLAHLAQLRYAGEWKFWSASEPTAWLMKAVRGRSAADIEYVYLVRARRIARAVVAIDGGRIIAIEYLTGIVEGATDAQPE